MRLIMTLLTITLATVSTSVLAAVMDTTSTVSTLVTSSQSKECHDMGIDPSHLELNVIKPNLKLSKLPVLTATKQLKFAEQLKKIEFQYSLMSPNCTYYTSDHKVTIEGDLFSLKWLEISSPYNKITRRCENTATALMYLTQHETQQEPICQVSLKSKPIK